LPDEKKSSNDSDNDRVTLENRLPANQTTWPDNPARNPGVTGNKGCQRLRGGAGEYHAAPDTALDRLARL
jgi:hypothetical protein